MLSWARRQFSTFHGFLSKFPGFSNREKNSLHFLNGAQFFGALNDNIYKLVLIFYLIQLEGAAHANSILSAAGAIFVIPFLLFSSAAGILADRYSKNRLIIAIKTTEILIMLLAIGAFLLKITWGCYVLLFLLATQSALFGPSKYGIIPELVPKHKVSKANGFITSFTYLAIIGGTFLASSLTDLTDRNYVIIGLVCLAVALLGFLSSFGIKHTPPKGTKKKIDPFFVRQIIQTLSECKNLKHLQLAIFSSGYFLFIGGFAQLNIIPYAMDALGYTEIAGGYLFLTTAVGIAVGAVIGGRASKREIELGLTCLSSFAIAILLFFLTLSTSHISVVLAALFLIGLFGGTFIVPLETFVQLFSPEAIRGHVIAAANFFSFVGVLIASIALYLFNELLGLSAATSFSIIGWITLGYSFFLALRFSDLLLSYTAKKILYRLIPVKCENLRLFKKASHPLLMLEDGSFLKAWLLSGYIPNLHILIPQHRIRRFPFFERLFFSIHRIESPQKFETLITHSKQFQGPDAVPCISLQKKRPIPEKQTFSMSRIFQKKSYEVFYVNFTRPVSGRGWNIRFSSHEL